MCSPQQIIFGVLFILYEFAAVDVKLPWLTLQYDDRGWYKYFQHGSSSRFTSESFEYFYNHQNPENCDDKKYMLVLSHNWGHGSSLHQLAFRFTAALHQNRIVVYDNDWVWANTPKCNKRDLDCYFAPISKCSPSNIYDIVWENATDEDAFKTLNNAKYISSIHTPYMRQKIIEDDQCNTLSLSYINKHYGAGDIDRTFYGGQAMRFFTRPNVMLYAEIKKMLESSLMVLYPDASKPVSAFENGVLHPPENCLSIHIRHGDKWSETKLHSLSEYLDEADKLVLNHPELVRHVIFSTDDEHVLDELISNVTSRRNYTFYYTQFFRQNEGGPPMAVAENSVGVFDFTVHAMLNLMLSTHPAATAFVHLSGSNWNHMIHEFITSDCLHKQRYVFDFEHKFDKNPN